MSGNSNSTFGFTTFFDNNAVFVIDALGENDMQTGLKVYNKLRDLRDYAGHKEHIVERVQITDGGDLRTVLDQIRMRCANDGLRPILHFESHGDERGLEIGETQVHVSWDVLETLLRPINVACEGHLGVVMSVCQGLYAIRPVKLHRHAPFLFLVGTQEKILQGALADQLPAFYEELFASGELDTALEKVPSCKPFHAEKLLASGVAGYFKTACMGAGAAQRAEELLTGSKWLLGGFESVEQMRDMRQAAKQKIKSDVSAEILQRYAEPFLGRRRCSFSFEEMLAWLKS